MKEVKQLQKHADTALHLSMEYRTAVEVLLPEVWHGQRVKKGEDLMKDCKGSRAGTSTILDGILSYFIRKRVVRFPAMLS